MEKSVILCPVCRRILSVGASMPAICVSAIPGEVLRRLPRDDVEHHPLAHDGCVEVFVDVPDDLDGQALLDAVMTSHGDKFVAVLAAQIAAQPPPLPKSP